jgi:hypothetical protein
MRIRQEIQALLWQNHTALSLFDPSGLDTGMQNNGVTLATRYLETIENACIPSARAAL